MSGRVFADGGRRIARRFTTITTGRFALLVGVLRLFRDGTDPAWRGLVAARLRGARW